VEVTPKKEAIFNGQIMASPGNEVVVGAPAGKAMGKVMVVVVEEQTTAASGAGGPAAANAAMDRQKTVA